MAHSGTLESQWHVAPSVSIWVDPKPRARGRTWVISGDLPTDYIHLDSHLEARDAMRALAARWKTVAAAMLRGESHAEMKIGDAHERRQQSELGDLLRKRADLLAKWADDDSYW